MSGSSPHPPDADVRMRGFSRRATVQQALTWVDQQAQTLPGEACPLRHAVRRVLTTDIHSAVDVPSFDRSMMDGFALQAAQTQGASAYNPLPLKIVAEILPGAPWPHTLRPGQAARIMTGAPLPSGADAVLPAELAQVQADQVWAHGEVPPAKHVGRRGEDIQAGQRVLPRGRRLRPQDLGLLSSIGQAEVCVVRQPRVRILVTGNELMPAGERAASCHIADANGPMLTSLVERDGGQILDVRLLPDDADRILQAMLDDTDVVLISGGTSVGVEDHAPCLLARHGQLAIHGIAMRPSSPTGMGRIGNRLVFLLPGNPVSCLCAYDFFAGRALRLLGGLAAVWPYRRVRLPLGRKLVSQVGRVDYARVAVRDGQIEPLAISGASVLSSTTRADGFVVIGEDCEGFAPGTQVEVFLYDD